jgi:hypothetical protein
MPTRKAWLVAKEKIRVKASESPPITVAAPARPWFFPSRSPSRPGTKNIKQTKAAIAVAMAIRRAPISCVPQRRRASPADSRIASLGEAAARAMIGTA